PASIRPRSRGKRCPLETSTPGGSIQPPASDRNRCEPLRVVAPLRMAMETEPSTRRPERPQIFENQSSVRSHGRMPFPQQRVADRTPPALPPAATAPIRLQKTPTSAPAPPTRRRQLAAKLARAASALSRLPESVHQTPAEPPVGESTLENPAHRGRPARACPSEPQPPVRNTFEESVPRRCGNTHAHVPDFRRAPHSD